MKIGAILNSFAIGLIILTLFLLGYRISKLEANLQAQQGIISGLKARYNRLLQVAVPNKNQACKGDEQVYVCIQPERAK
jgi:hypothetical protein